MKKRILSILASVFCLTLAVSTVSAQGYSADEVMKKIMHKERVETESLENSVILVVLNGLGGMLRETANKLAGVEKSDVEKARKLVAENITYKFLKAARFVTDVFLKKNSLFVEWLEDVSSEFPNECLKIGFCNLACEVLLDPESKEKQADLEAVAKKLIEKEKNISFIRDFDFGQLTSVDLFEFKQRENDPGIVKRSGVQAERHKSCKYKSRGKKLCKNEKGCNFCRFASYVEGCGVCQNIIKKLDLPKKERKNLLGLTGQEKDTYLEELNKEIRAKRIKKLKERKAMKLNKEKLKLEKKKNEEIATETLKIRKREKEELHDGLIFELEKKKEQEFSEAVEKLKKANKKSLDKEKKSIEKYEVKLALHRYARPDENKSLICLFGVASFFRLEFKLEKEKAVFEERQAKKKSKKRRSSKCKKKKRRSNKSAELAEIKEYLEQYKSDTLIQGTRGDTLLEYFTELMNSGEYEGEDRDSLIEIFSDFEKLFLDILEEKVEIAVSSSKSKDAEAKKLRRCSLEEVERVSRDLSKLMLLDKQLRDIAGKFKSKYPKCSEAIEKGIES
jgi:hypothetical protein